MQASYTASVHLRSCHRKPQEDAHHQQIGQASKQVARHCVRQVKQGLAARKEKKNEEKEQLLNDPPKEP